jgi:hypothetical protein
VVITDYEAELGGFNWKTWVDLSENYTSSDFTDLDDLLSDETAIRELMTIHACVDYLAGIAAESADVETIIGNDLAAKWINNRDYALDTLYANEIIADYMDEADKYFYGEWIITDNTTTPPTWGAKGNVPVMTSDSAPYGAASSSSNYTGCSAYWAFGGNVNGWQSALNSNTGTLTYKFVNPVCARKVHYYANGVNKSFTYEIRGSNDGFATYDVLYSGSYTYSGSGDVEIVLEPEFDNDKYYLYYAIYGTSNRGSVFRVVLLQYYGRELSVSVPVMTSNTTPYGEVSASSVYSADYSAWKAFNFSETRGWAASASGLTDAWVQYEFVTPMVIKKFVATMGTNSYLNNMKVQGSNDGFVNDINDLLTFSVSASATIVENVTNSTPYKYYRVFGTTNASGNGYHFQFYGLDYSEREFEEGTNKKWLYDHGLELETFTAISSAVGVATKEPSDLYIAKTSTSNGQVGFYSPDIDLTSYSLFRGIVANRLSNIGYPRLYIGNSGQTSLTGSEPAMLEIRSKSYNAIDVSSFNSNYRVIFGIHTNSTNIADANINELWLE